MNKHQFSNRPRTQTGDEFKMNPLNQLKINIIQTWLSIGITLLIQISLICLPDTKSVRRHTGPGINRKIPHEHAMRQFI